MVQRNKRKPKIINRTINDLIAIPTAKSNAQENYLQQLHDNVITFVSGPPGSGKTFMATLFGLNEFMKGTYRKLIFTRPYIEACGEKIGFLPGSQTAKMEGMLMPILDILEESLSTEQMEGLLHSKEILMIPMGYLRGLTFKNSFVLLDESQSTTPEQMHLFLTRVGKGSKVVITGDLRQSDIRGKNGLTDAINRLRGIEGIGFVELDAASIVRHPLIVDIEKRYALA